MDLYAILEIKPNASELEIKKAYHKLLKQYHPDKNNTHDANNKYQKIQLAYEVLTNDKSRQEYHTMDVQTKTNFVEILEKIIKENFNIDELKKYGINLSDYDFKYLEKNFMNFFRAINVGELLELFKKGIVTKKEFISCSESDLEIYDETFAEYYFSLPISVQKINPNDIKIELNISLGDIASNNKRKIKIKRNINDNIETSTFIFKLSSPYIVFIDAGDHTNGISGNLIIKLNLPPNFYWTKDLILIEQPISLYEMVYGLDIYLDLGENKIINVVGWVPSRDGFLIEISNNYNIKFNFKLEDKSLAIKLFIDYENSAEKEQILKQFFS